MTRKKRKGIALAALTKRGAALNRAIIRVLGAKQPQTTRQIGKNVAAIPEYKDTRCSTVNKRVRDLEKRGYLIKSQVKERVGGVTNYYELTPKAYLAKYLDLNSVEDLFEHASDEAALIILATLIDAQQN